jgi:cell division transport system permease protein
MSVILKRIIRAGLLSFSRSGLVSWAAVLVTTVTLLVVTSLIFLQVVLFFWLNQIENKVDVTIYFTVGAPENQIMALRESILKLPEVAEVAFTDAENALRLFRERHASDYPTIQALEELNDNPLGAYLNVRAKEISQYESIANFLKSDDALVLSSAPIIYKINYYQNKLVIDRLNSIIAGAQKLGFLVTLAFVFISIVITFNTIRLTIFIAKEEIGVMRLVGASKWRVRGPFMIEGAIYGALATVLTMVISWPVTAWFGRNMTDWLGINLYNYFISNFLQIFIIILISGVFLGVASSFLAVRKYLNK